MSRWSISPISPSPARTTITRRAIRPIGGASTGSIADLLLRRGVAEKLAAHECAAGAAGARTLCLRRLAAARGASLFPRSLDAGRTEARAIPRCAAPRWRRRWNAIGPRRPKTRHRPAPHETGGAVDLTLRWSDGEALWMGSLFDDVTAIAHRDRFEGASTRLSLFGRRSARQSPAAALADASRKASPAIPTNGGTFPGAISCGRR